MKKTLIIIISVLLITGCTTNKSSEPPAEVPQDINSNENETKENEEKIVMAPDFELQNMDDTSIKLSEMRDKNVILNFWYTGCQFCVMEMPDLQKLQDTYKDDLLILAINTGEKKDTVESFMSENNLSFTVLIDEKMEVTNTYGIRSFPSTIAINKKGEIIGGYIGMLTYEQMEKLYEFFE